MAAPGVSLATTKAKFEADGPSSGTLLSTADSAAVAAAVLWGELAGADFTAPHVFVSYTGQAEPSHQINFGEKSRKLKLTENNEV